MFFAMVLMFAMEIFGSSGTGPPNVAGFTPVLSKELEFQIDDYKTAFVGRMVVYQNPEETDEAIIATQKRRLSWVKKECDVVFCISKKTRDDAIKFLDIAEAKLKVVYPGI